jgi:hypothetical protein
MPPPGSIESSFRLLYGLRFEDARAELHLWQSEHSEDPVGYGAEAASFLFEEFYRQGVLTSEFFLDNKKFFGGITGRPDENTRKGFLEANRRARDLAAKRRKVDPTDPEALFALTMVAGMQADYAAIIEKEHFASLRYMLEAEEYARDLLAMRSDYYDAYLAIGIGNYIIGSLPAYKRFFLRLGGVRGNKLTGMAQVEMAANRGRYLRPFAKIMLALASRREKQEERARLLWEDLAAEFPENALFARELALSRSRVEGAAGGP